LDQSTPGAWQLLLLHRAVLMFVLQWLGQIMSPAVVVLLPQWVGLTLVMVAAMMAATAGPNGNPKPDEGCNGLRPRTHNSFCPLHSGCSNSHKQLFTFCLLLQWVALTLGMAAPMMAANRGAPATTHALMARWMCTSTCQRYVLLSRRRVMLLIFYVEWSVAPATTHALIKFLCVDGEVNVYLNLPKVRAVVLLPCRASALLCQMVMR
jgi:hypothetical protein